MLCMHVFALYGVAILAARLALQIDILANSLVTCVAKCTYRSITWSWNAWHLKPCAEHGATRVDPAEGAARPHIECCRCVGVARVTPRTCCSTAAATQLGCALDFRSPAKSGHGRLQVQAQSPTIPDRTSHPGFLMIFVSCSYGHRLQARTAASPIMTLARPVMSQPNG